VEVVLEYGDRWRMLIRDGGPGFDVASTDSGFGRNSMQLHAQALGGSLRLTSTVATGTTVEAILP
jgi:signal transduction histidine kinase